MKKIFSILAIVSVLGFVLVGCKSDAGTTDAGTTTGSTSTSSTTGK
jgi:hypothetical protein